MTEILLAGDNFVRNDLLGAAIKERLAGAAAFTTLTLPWPQVPYGRVAEVDEASDCEEELVEAIADAEILVTQMAPVTARVLERARALRLIVCTRGGPVNVNVEAAAARGIAVSCTPGRNAVAAAEYALLLMMAAQRRLPAAHDSMVAGEWRSWMYDYDECGLELGGSTVGVIGLGEIGRRVAALVRAVGATVLAHDPFVAPEDAGGTDLVGLDELLAESDTVTLHARMTPQTAGMIGAAELSLMKPGAILVNTARGGLLDYDAAVAALRSGGLGALALDVYATEPLPVDSPLLTMDRVVLSPHLAGATRQTATFAAAIAAEEVSRYVDGQPLRHVVNGVRPGGGL